MNQPTNNKTKNVPRRKLARKVKNTNQRINNLANQVAKVNIAHTKEVKQIRTLRKKVKPQNTKISDCSYIKVLMDPFTSRGGKIPQSSRYGITFPFRNTYMTSFTCNPSGDAFIYWSPESVSDTSGTYSPLLIDNGATYNPVTGGSTAINPINTGASLGWTSADCLGISIVSAGMKIYFENASTTLQPKGRVFAMREATSNTVSGVSMLIANTYITQQNEHPLAYIINSKTHKEFKNDNYAAIECVYQPRSRLAFEMTGTAQPPSLNPSNARMCDEFSLILTKFETTTQVYIELFYHYEVIVQADGNYKSFGDYNTCVADPLPLVAQLAQNNDLWLRQSRIDDDHKHAVMNSIKQASNQVTPTFQTKPYMAYTS